MYIDLVKKLVDRLNTEKEDLARNIARGGCPDFAEYKQSVGRVKQLDADIETIKEVAQSYLEDDDLEELEDD